VAWVLIGCHESLVLPHLLVFENWRGGFFSLALVEKEN